MYVTLISRPEAYLDNKNKKKRDLQKFKKHESKKSVPVLPNVNSLMLSHVCFNLIQSFSYFTLPLSTAIFVRKCEYLLLTILS
jgi:hypothetical protein